jgi:hypothetical protein
MRTQQRQAPARSGLARAARAARVCRVQPAARAQLVGRRIKRRVSSAAGANEKRAAAHAAPRAGGPSSHTPSSPLLQAADAAAEAARCGGGEEARQEGRTDARNNVQARRHQRCRRSHLRHPLRDVRQRAAPRCACVTCAGRHRVSAHPGRARRARCADAESCACNRGSARTASVGRLRVNDRRRCEWYASAQSAVRAAHAASRGVLCRCERQSPAHLAAAPARWRRPSPRQRRRRA